MCLLCVCHLSALGQTKIGVTGSATKTDALVEMGDDLGNKKGLVIPRVKLVSINSSLPMSSHIAGMIVYNTDASGSVPNNVVPGFYYNDGSKWVLTNPSTVPNATALETGKVQLAGDLSGTSSSATAPRVSGLQGTAVSATAPTNGQVLAYNGSSWMPTTSVSVVSSTSPIAVASGTSTPVISLNSLGITNGFLAANAVTSDKILDNTIVNGDLAVGTGGIYRGSGALGGATVVTGNANTLSFTSTVTNGFSIDGTTFSVDAANDRVGIGTATPNAKLDIRSDPFSISNPGNGYFGLGTTAIAANTAGAGAIRYNTSTGGNIEYSNGVVWNVLTSTVKRSIVQAYKVSAQLFPTLQTTNVVGWVEEVDESSNFDPVTGIFTAPRDGSYTVSFSYEFRFDKTLNDPELIVESSAESILYIISGSNISVRKCRTSIPSGGKGEIGSNLSFTLKLKAGDSVRPQIWHYTGGDRVLRVPGIINDSGYNNFSVVEL